MSVKIGPFPDVTKNVYVNNRRTTTMRIRPADLQEIDQNAKARGMSRTAFMVSAALKRLPEHRTSLEQRVTELEQQVEQHQRLLDLSQ